MQKLNDYRNIPQANKLHWIMSLLSYCVCWNGFAKFWYRFHPSTAIQKNAASKKYCINAAMNWQPICGFTLSTPAKNITSSATKEEERHRIILEESFLRTLLNREISMIFLYSDKYFHKWKRYRQKIYYKHVHQNNFSDGYNRQLYYTRSIAIEKLPTLKKKKQVKRFLWWLCC